MNKKQRYKKLERKRKNFYNEASNWTEIKIYERFNICFNMSLVWRFQTLRIM